MPRRRKFVLAPRMWERVARCSSQASCLSWRAYFLAPGVRSCCEPSLLYRWGVPIGCSLLLDREEFSKSCLRCHCAINQCSWRVSSMAGERSVGSIICSVFVSEYCLSSGITLSIRNTNQWILRSSAVDWNSIALTLFQWFTFFLRCCSAGLWLTGHLVLNRYEHIFDGHFHFNFHVVFILYYCSMEETVTRNASSG